MRDGAGKPRQTFLAGMSCKTTGGLYKTKQVGDRRMPSTGNLKDHGTTRVVCGFKKNIDTTVVQQQQYLPRKGVEDAAAATDAQPPRQEIRPMEYESYIYSEVSRTIASDPRHAWRTEIPPSRQGRSFNRQPKDKTSPLWCRWSMPLFVGILCQQVSPFSRYS